MILQVFKVNTSSTTMPCYDIHNPSVVFVLQFMMLTERSYLRNFLIKGNLVYGLPEWSKYLASLASRPLEGAVIRRNFSFFFFPRQDELKRL